MAETKIEWCDFTFNPWRGCTHVSPGCTNCYAEALSKRNPAQLGTWGAGGERVIASEAYWRQPERWNRAAEKAGTRARVFCASLADVFEDREDLIEPRVRLRELIEATPCLDWLLLTKRPDQMREWANYEYDARDGEPHPNVWLGTTVEDQRRADERIPILLDTPAAVRFLSCEPLLGPVDLSRWLGIEWFDSFGWGTEMFAALRDGHRRAEGLPPAPALDWVIAGGESGPNARPLDIGWVRSLLAQSRAAEVPCFVKQLGRRPFELLPYFDSEMAEDLLLRDRKGGDLEEWPADLRVREFPASGA